MPVLNQSPPYQYLQVGQAIRIYTGMRTVWDEHVQLTRMLIISFAAGLPDFQVAQQRLLQNQATIASTMSPYIGASSANQLHALLVQHIQQSVPVLQAAKAGDQAALASAVAAWRANASQISQLLAQRVGLPYEAVNEMMQHHLDTTIAEASARLKGNWIADVAAYDAVRTHILGMADTLSGAIARNLPLKVT